MLASGKINSRAQKQPFWWLRRDPLTSYLGLRGKALGPFPLLLLGLLGPTALHNNIPPSQVHAQLDINSRPGPAEDKEAVPLTDSHDFPPERPGAGPRQTHADDLG